jgi:hypothetical protein
MANHELWPSIMYSMVYLSTFILRQFSLEVQFCCPLLLFLLVDGSGFCPAWDCCGEDCPGCWDAASALSLFLPDLRDRRPNTNDAARGRGSDLLKSQS